MARDFLRPGGQLFGVPELGRELDAGASVAAAGPAPADARARRACQVGGIARWKPGHRTGRLAGQRERHRTARRRQRIGDRGDRDPVRQWPDRAGRGRTARRHPVGRARRCRAARLADAVRTAAAACRQGGVRQPHDRVRAALRKLAAGLDRVQGRSAGVGARRRDEAGRRAGHRAARGRRRRRGQAPRTAEAAVAGRISRSRSTPPTCAASTWSAPSCCCA